MVALGAYSQLLRLKGDTTSADHYDTVNHQFVQYWMANGLVSDAVSNNSDCTDVLQTRDHYKRQYDLPDSWSFKYNLVFQVNLG